MWRKYNRREALRLKGLAEKKITSKRGLGDLWLTVKQSGRLYGLSVNMPDSTMQQKFLKMRKETKEAIK